MKSKLAQFKDLEHLPMRQILQKMHVSDTELLSLIRTWRSQGLL